MNLPYQLLEAPSVLGLWPSGVERLPEALRGHGFFEGYAPPRRVAGDVADFSPRRSSEHDVLNAAALAAYTRRLAVAVQQTRAEGRFPNVLGGDCSILLGCVLGLKATGRFGLAHLDAHADFYQPEADAGEPGAGRRANFRGAKQPAGRCWGSSAGQQLQASAGRLRVGQAAGLACLSERQFERRFSALVGVAPKELAGLLRFRAACPALAGDARRPAGGRGVGRGLLRRGAFGAGLWPLRRTNADAVPGLAR